MLRMQSHLQSKFAQTTVNGAPHAPLSERKCACANHTIAGGGCEACGEKQLQRSAVRQSGLPQVPSIVHEVLRSPGQPLEPQMRDFMEPRFGHDFSRVRVHTDARAAESAQAVNAVAYTVGHNVVFGGSQYVPGTKSGQQLLAHELTHVVQQQNASPAATLGIDAVPEMESEATQAESNFRPSSLSGPVTALQRKVNGKGEEDLCGGTWGCASSPCEQADPGRKGSGGIGSTWSLKVMIDTEEEKARQVISHVGHTYVEFTDLTGSVFTYGFYPHKSKAANPITHPRVAGCVVHPDTNHRNCVDYTETFDNLGEAEFQAALLFAQQTCLDPPIYDIHDYNCTTFAKEVAAKAGKTLPPLSGKVSPLGLRFDNPNTLKEGLKKRDAGPTYNMSSNAKIRDTISKASLTDLAAASVGEKIRVIKELLEGRVSDDDLTAIEKVCESALTKDELQAIAAAIQDAKNKIHDAARKIRLQTALSRK